MTRNEEIINYANSFKGNGMENEELKEVIRFAIIDGAMWADANPNIDAFVEKACVKLKKLMYDNLMFQGRLHREEVIDNFVEDFKNYMKEE